VYTDVLNYDYGSISHTFGILVSNCTHTQANCKLLCIRLLFMCMLKYQTMVQGTFILRQSLTNGWLLWLFKVFPREGGWFVVESEKQDTHMHVGYAAVCDSHKLQ
jgi:hypothetical protein